MTNRIQLPLTVRVLAAKQAAAFLEDISGMNAVVVATEDGFDIASAMKTGDAARIAALASSISAISAVVSQEASLGADKCVTIDTHDGFAVVYSAPRKDARPGHHRHCQRPGHPGPGCLPRQPVRQRPGGCLSPAFPSRPCGERCVTPWAVSSITRPLKNRRRSTWPPSNKAWTS